MKYTLIKNILIALIPTGLFWGYRVSQLWLEMHFRFNNMVLVWVSLFRMLAPAFIGALLVYIIIYMYKNRNSLLFIWMFCGIFLVNILYAVYAFTEGPWNTYAYVFRTAAPEIVYTMAGAYIVGFWVSIISYLKEKKKQNKERKQKKLQL